MTELDIIAGLWLFNELINYTRDELLILRPWQYFSNNYCISIFKRTRRGCRGGKKNVFHQHNGPFNNSIQQDISRVNSIQAN